MKRKFLGALLILGLLAALCAPALAADKYTIDLSSISDKEWDDSRVSLSFILNGNNRVNAYLSDTADPAKQPYWNKTMGNPVLLNYVVDEATQQKMPITWVPIRLICDCLQTPIQWVPKTDTEEAHAVIHTTNGDVKLYVNATQIEYTDDNGNPQVYEETTYRFPDNTPVPLCLIRNSRIYVPVRAISTFLLDSVSFNWRQADYLEVTANTKGTTTEKTYGVNMNYYNPGNGSMDWSSMPNLMAALEGKDWAIPNLDRPGLTQEGVFLYTKSGRVSQTLAITYFYDSTGTNKVLKISGFHGTQMYVEQLPVIEGALKDLICDADRESIMGLLSKIAENSSPGFTMEKGATAEAIEWVKNQPKEYSFKEVKVSADEWLTDFTITTK